MRVEKMGTKSDTLVKLVLVFFISLLSFSIGTFVGKKYSDNQHKLAQLEPSGASHHGEESEGHASAAHDTKSEHEKADSASTMTDAEIAKLAEEFVSEEEPVKTAAHDEAKVEEKAEAHGEKAEAHPTRATASVPAKPVAVAAAPTHEVTAEKIKAAEVKKSPTSASAVKPTEAHQKASEKISEIAEQVATEKILVEKKTESTSAPTTLPKEVVHTSVGKFTVQIASHPDEADAKKLAEELKKKGYAAFYVPANVKGQVYYRVSVGLFATQKEAASYRSELIEKANVGSAFVQKIIQ